MKNNLSPEEIYARIITLEKRCDEKDAKLGRLYASVETLKIKISDLERRT